MVIRGKRKRNKNGRLSKDCYFRDSGGAGPAYNKVSGPVGRCHIVKKRSGPVVSPQLPVGSAYPLGVLFAGLVYKTDIRLYYPERIHNDLIDPVRALASTCHEHDKTLRVFFCSPCRKEILTHRVAGNQGFFAVKTADRFGKRDKDPDGKSFKKAVCQPGKHVLFMDDHGYSHKKSRYCHGA